MLPKYDMSKNTVMGEAGEDIIVYPEYPTLSKEYKEDDSKLGVHIFSRAHIHPFTVTDWVGEEQVELTFQSVDHYVVYLTATEGDHSHKHQHKGLKIAQTDNKSARFYKQWARKFEPRFYWRDEDGLSSRDKRAVRRMIILERAYYGKFSAPECASLRRYLSVTKNAILVEDVPHDNDFGTGHRVNSKAFKEISNWRGYNYAGQSLMNVRDKLARQH